MEATERHLHLVPPLPEEDDPLHCWKCFKDIPDSTWGLCETCWALEQIE